MELIEKAESIFKVGTIINRIEISLPGKAHAAYQGRSDSPVKTNVVLRSCEGTYSISKKS
jgi:hypothetical protein